VAGHDIFKDESMCSDTLCIISVNFNCIEIKRYGNTSFIKFKQFFWNSQGAKTKIPKQIHNLLLFKKIA
jgi:hypothetical protein